MHRKRILVVDDNQSVVDGLVQELSQWFEVEGVHSGLVALERCLKGDSLDGLIVDVDLGSGMSGVEIVQIVRAHNPTIRIILFSATDYSDAVRLRAEELKAAFFEKPLPREYVVKFLEGSYA